MLLSYYDSNCWETASERGLSFFLCLDRSFLSAQPLCGARLRWRKTAGCFKGCGAWKKGGLQTETCGRYPVQYLPWGREGTQRNGRWKEREWKNNRLGRSLRKKSWAKSQSREVDPSSFSEPPCETILTIQPQYWIESSQRFAMQSIRKLEATNGQVTWQSLVSSAVCVLTLALPGNHR